MLQPCRGDERRPLRDVCSESGNLKLIRKKKSKFDRLTNAYALKITKQGVI